MTSQSTPAAQPRRCPRCGAGQLFRESDIGGVGGDRVVLNCLQCGYEQYRGVPLPRVIERQGQRGETAAERYERGRRRAAT